MRLIKTKCAVPVGQWFLTKRQFDDVCWWALWQKSQPRYVVMYVAPSGGVVPSEQRFMSVDDWPLHVYSMQAIDEGSAEACLMFAELVPDRQKWSEFAAAMAAKFND